MKNYFKKTFTIFSLLTLPFLLYSETNQESKDFIAKTVSRNNGAKTIAITRDFGMLAVYRRCNVAAADVSNQLIDNLQKMNDNHEEIRDVHIDEDGRWVILGDSIILSPDCSPDLIAAVNDFLQAKEKILSISFNRNDDWCVLTEEKFKCSSTEMTDFILRAFELYGDVKYVFIGPNNTIVTCENSAVWTKKVSKEFYAKLTESEFTPTIIKYFYDGSYFFANPAEGRSTFSF
ncbi:MAG: hypothetical protein K5829_12970 [Treponema sp.]|nr:hypothetical protein [Treponema sp.]